MNRAKIIFAFLCLLIPLFTLFYKSQFLNISLIPQETKNLWKVEISLNWKIASQDARLNSENLMLPILQSTPSQIIKSIATSPSNQKVSIIENPGGPLLRLKPEEVEKKREFAVSGQLQLFGHSDLTQTPIEAELDPFEASKYKDLSTLSEPAMEDLKNLSTSILFTTDTPLQKLRKIFFYMSDEMILQPDVDDIREVIGLNSGSQIGQARLLTALARLNDIPARMAFGVHILDQGQKKNYKYQRVFYTEVFINGRWAPINPNYKEFGSLPDNFIVIHRDCENLVLVLNHKELLSIYAEPIKFSSFGSSEEYVGKLASEHKFWSLLSLHRFPLAVQAIFFGLLLIPFGTVILSFCRVMIGVNTFGIFTPILLTLFFLETSFIFGFSFFVIVVLLGFFQRYVLDKFYLLAVPRLSILLTFVIIIYVGFALVLDYFGLLNVGDRNLNYFPIVIITVFIERFSIYFIEEGPRNTLKTAFGTLLVACLCYVLLSFTWLKVFLFNNPELLLLSIGLNIFIGSYKGYRLIEYFRFSGLKGSAS